MPEEAMTSQRDLTAAETEAALARLRDWAARIKAADIDTDTGTLDLAADLAAVFEARHWVADLPPDKRLGRRKARRDTQQQFARWTRLNPGKIGRAYTQSRISQLLAAARLRPLVYNPVINNGERALRPLTGKFAAEHPDEIPAVLQRAKELADRQPLTAAIVKRALADHNKAVRPASRRQALPARTAPRDKHAAERDIRARFDKLLEQGRRRDAGELINLLIADYNAGKQA
jgi:hypothetical protein